MSVVLGLPVLHKITNRITSEVEGINRVLYDLTPKPVGTIEWERVLLRKTQLRLPAASYEL